MQLFCLQAQNPTALTSPQPRIDASRGQQLGMRALLYDAAGVPHHQTVQRRDGRWAVGVAIKVLPSVSL
ncbi:MAG: hypothetical protein C0423_13515 [Methylibium sp.]|nr:hypothetical protein [Methylibium sp.]